MKIEWTRQVFENIAPNAKVKPAINSQARAVQTKIDRNFFENPYWDISRFRLNFYCLP